MSEVIVGMSDTEYHSNPGLSSTGVRLLLPEFKGSPKKFQWAQTHRRDSRAFDVGHAAHARILGVGAGVIAYPDEHLTPSGNVSTKAATVAWEDEQRAAGLTPVSPADIAAVEGMAEAVLAHPTAAPLLEVAVLREVSVFADVDGVPSRARFDALSDGTGRVVAVDLKTAYDATPNGFTRSITKYGYDVQQAHYEAVCEAATGNPIDTFTFIVVEKQPPYEVGVFTIEPFWVDMGRAKVKRARDLFRECTESGVWPGYDPEPVELTAPAWVTIEHEMAYESEIRV